MAGYGAMETKGCVQIWSYAALGDGEQWWRAFCYRLPMAGDEGWLSIEYEDVMRRRREG